MSLEEQKWLESYLFKTVGLFGRFRVFVLEFVHSEGLIVALLSVFFLPLFVFWYSFCRCKVYQ